MHTVYSNWPRFDSIMAMVWEWRIAIRNIVINKFWLTGEEAYYESNTGKQCIGESQDTALKKQRI